MRQLGRFCRRIRTEDRGSGVVEFVLLAVIVFIPLTYGVLAFSAVQSTVLASTDAARQAGRALATASDPTIALKRAEYAAALAADAQNIDAAGIQVWTAPASTDCSSSDEVYAAALTSGEVFAVCVEIPIRLPLLPEVLSSNTATGKYVVAMDSFR
ncbi:MAG: TadE/TadG family type IV pilus assembly protein [Cumulibacter sp.]